MCKKNLILIVFLVLGLLSMVPGPAFSSSEKGPEKIIKQAEAKEEAGDYEGAQALYEGVLKQSPDFEPALSRLAQVEYWQGNYQGAIETNAKILLHDPDNVKALVGTGKAYLAMGKQRKAQEFFNRAEKRDAGNEEVEAIKPELENKTKMEINGGYITEEMSYAPEAQGEFQEIRVVKENTFAFGLNTIYLKKFGQTGFDTQLYSSYNLLENTRIDLGVDFSPRTALFPKVGASASLAQTFWNLTAKVDYNYQNYRQATLQTVRPGLFFHPFDFMKIGGGYEYQHLQFGATKQNFNGAFAEASVTPLESLSLRAFYSHVRRGFEAGRTPSPYINYTANIGGGGISFEFMKGYQLKFDASFESRNNGESKSDYIVSAGYVF